jgi:hypothetical protein
VALFFGKGSAKPTGLAGSAEPPGYNGCGASNLTFNHFETVITAGRNSLTVPGAKKNYYK